MIVSQWLTTATGSLLKAGISTSRLDALVLLEDTTGKDRAWLLANPTFILETDLLKKLNLKIARRVKHEPLAYIRGKSEFYGREFTVTPATLQPRPETETMIDVFNKLVNTEHSAKNKAIIDVGTGSGCIAITTKLEWPMLEVLATEINKEALKIAKQNAKALQANIVWFEGSLLEPLIGLSPPPELFAILANLPYVPDDHIINEAAMQEPRLAIFGGKDGLDLYRQLFQQINQLRTKPTYLLTESLPPQHSTLADIAAKNGYHLDHSEDFIQVFKLS